MHKQTIRLQAILDQADAKERDRCADRAPNDSADSVVDRYFTELLQLVANDVDLVKAAKKSNQAQKRPRGRSEGLSNSWRRPL